MSNFQNVEIMQKTVQKKSFAQRHFPTFCKAGAVIGSVAVATSANAADVDGLFTSISGSLGGVSTGVLSILTILAGVIALLIGWSYVKKAK